MPEKVSKRELNRIRNENFEKEQEKLNNFKKSDAIRRYAFLLGKTDIFAHFLKLHQQRNEHDPALDALLEDSKKKNSKNDGYLLKNFLELLIYLFYYYYYFDFSLYLI